MGNVIFHVDVNSAFLSWEAVYRLTQLGGTVDLREQISAVGGDIAKRHGIILAKSVPAKAYDIKTGESVVEALHKCPKLIVVPPNYTLYKQCSDAFISILHRFSPVVEQYSIDEAFTDMTGTEKLWGEPMTAANMIRETIFEELGFTVNIGVSSNKLLAKMAGDFKKPNLVHSLFPNEIQTKMWPLPVSDLFYVGRATAKKLKSLGINTIGQLAKKDPKILKYHLHKHGELVWAFANGFDMSAVEPVAVANKGYGNSTTIAFDIVDPSTAKLVLLSLAETVCTRLRKDNKEAGVVSISIRRSDLTHYGHQKVLFQSTNITSEIHRYAAELFDEAWDGKPIRHIGLQTSRVRENQARQLGLFDSIDPEKESRLEAAVDQIRERFGDNSVKRCSLLSGRIDHMSGGVSKEKLTVDYSEIEIL